MKWGFTSWISGILVAEVGKVVYPPGVEIIQSGELLFLS